MNAIVKIDDESLGEFEKLSYKAPLLRIDSVEINLSLYGSLQAQDIHAFGEYCSGIMISNAELVQFFDRVNDPDIGRAFDWGLEWNSEFPWPQNNPSESFVTLNKLYQEYERKFKAQELTMANNSHLKIITKALKLINPRRIIINDDLDNLHPYNCSVSDVAIQKHIIRRSKILLTPPEKVQTILTDMFEVFAKEEICPESFALNIKAAWDMTGLMFPGYDSMKRFLGQCTDIEFTTSGLKYDLWGGVTLPDGRDPPRILERLRPLTQFSSNVLMAPKAKSLTLDLSDYAAGGPGYPDTSLRDWFPDGNWNLEELRLRFLPINISELKNLEKYKGSLRVLELNRVYLLDGSWLQALDILRALQLQKVTIKDLRGGQRRHWGLGDPGTSFMGWEDYIIGVREERPIL